MVKNLITTYQTFEEKEKYFSLNKKIETHLEVDELWKLLIKFKESGLHIFRGLDKSKYKLFNSAQRHYHNYNLVKKGIGYDEFITSNIEFTKQWNKNTIEKYLKCRGIQDNCVAYLSFMQHYRIPTPLLDFTTNPFVALFFSTSSTDDLVNEEIEKYSSLYFIYSKYWLLQGFQDFFQAMIEQNTCGQIKYKDIHMIPFLLFFDLEDKFQIINNQNIINQQGLFFFTSHQNLPIEEHYRLVIELHKNQETLPKETKSEFLGCWNINKKLNSYIRKKLKLEMGITEEYLFPNFNNLKEELEKAIQFENS